MTEAEIKLAAQTFVDGLLGPNDARREKSILDLSAIIQSAAAGGLTEEAPPAEPEEAEGEGERPKKKK